ncbi:hypothetical protein MSG28_007610 [Choristoneura fumiferana]|uniref:Uncharacterized protein n=1 Tax=Choristoneura fumiferana TaxID=7141 RepID=A0ACC0JY81_CHOFU|nr:hypothetical protein MSG28_007610 [Choristoneura fumiferana]
MMRPTNWTTGAPTALLAVVYQQRLANAELNVTFRGDVLKHNPNPKYLGVTLDRSLTYKTHLGKVAAKIRTRNNIVQKLTSTTWGASAACLRTTSLALVYSSAEYCAPVWLNSAHVSAVDSQLNHTMHLVTGCMRPTPTHWLHSAILLRHTCAENNASIASWTNYAGTQPYLLIKTYLRQSKGYNLATHQYPKYTPETLPGKCGTLGSDRQTDSPVGTLWVRNPKNKISVKKTMPKTVSAIAALHSVGGGAVPSSLIGLIAVRFWRFAGRCRGTLASLAWLVCCCQATNKILEFFGDVVMTQGIAELVSAHRALAPSVVARRAWTSASPSSKHDTRN